MFLKGTGREEKEMLLSEALTFSSCVQFVSVLREAPAEGIRLGQCFVFLKASFLRRVPPFCLYPSMPLSNPSS